MAKDQKVKHQTNLKDSPRLIKHLEKNCDFIAAVTSKKISSNSIKKRGLDVRPDQENKNIHLIFFCDGGKQHFFLVLKDGYDLEKSIRDIPEKMKNFKPFIPVKTPYDTNKLIKEVEEMGFEVNNKIDPNENIVSEKNINPEQTDNQINKEQNMEEIVDNQEPKKEISKAELIEYLKSMIYKGNLCHQKISQKDVILKEELKEWEEILNEAFKRKSELYDNIKKLKNYEEEKRQSIQLFTQKMNGKIDRDTLTEHIITSQELVSIFDDINTIENHTVENEQNIQETKNEITKIKREINRLKNTMIEIHKHKTKISELINYLRENIFENILKEIDLEIKELVIDNSCENKTIKISKDNNIKSEKETMNDQVGIEEGYFDYLYDEIKILKKLDGFGAYALCPNSATYLITKIKDCPGFKKSLFFAALGKSIKIFTKYIETLIPDISETIIANFYNNMCESSKVINGRFKTLNFMAIQNYINMYNKKNTIPKRNTSFANGKTLINYECD